MNFYRQSIALFGIALPALVSAILIGIGFFAKSQIVSSYKNKQALFKTYQADFNKTQEVEVALVRQRAHVERWNTMLAEESSSAVNNHLRTIAGILPAKEFQKTAFERTAGNAGFAAGSAQQSSQLKIIFRGTYRTMQRAFLELETRMPQLQLQELRIDPNSNQQNPSPLLNIQVTYTAWES